MDFDLEELVAIIELLDKTEFTDFRFEKGDLRIAVRRGAVLPDDVSSSAVAVPTVATAQASRSAAPAPTTAVVAAPSPARPATAPVADGDVVVTAPMLGTFYRAPKPGEPAFVEVGDKVDADAVLCIVEVMKLMNSIPAGVRGEITAVYAADGDLVEFGQPLFAIRPIA